jgi:hypothetical protein
LQFKDENRKFTGGKSRFEDAEVQEKMPKMLPGEFRNTRKLRRFSPSITPKKEDFAHVEQSARPQAPAGA